MAGGYGPLVTGMITYDKARAKLVQQTLNDCFGDHARFIHENFYAHCVELVRPLHSPEVLGSDVLDEVVSALLDVLSRFALYPSLLVDSPAYD